MKRIIDAFPRSAHPMGVLSSLTSALTAFNPKAVDVKSKEEMDHAAELMLQNSLIFVLGLTEKLKVYH
jgi:citrate synthase